MFLFCFFSHTVYDNRNYSNKYTHSLYLTSASTAVKDFCYTHTHTHTHIHTHIHTPERQPHTCRERVSQLSFVFEPGLRLNTVTTRPSSPPCTLMGSVIVLRNRRDVNSFGIGPLEAPGATWTPPPPGRRRPAVHSRLLS